ncbi:hypothetical protein ABIG06_005581 [Bradyrhizobium sp. USDA 326]
MSSSSGTPGAAAEQHVDDFLEVEQPKRQLQISRVEHQRAVAEAAAIFIVHVEQEDAQVRPRLQDLVEQQRDAGRFADAGRAQHGEMLGQHLLDIDIGDDGAVLLEETHIDLIRPGWRVDRAQLLAGDQVDGIADGRIIGDAALEFGLVRGVEDLAEQVDRGNGDVAVGARQILAGDLGDHRDDDRAGAANADETADGRPNLRDRHLACRQ